MAVTAAALRTGWLCVAVVLTLARSCGFTPDDRKSEGEPCTRSSECELGLECRGGVCMPEVPDGGGLDASSPRDAGSSRDAASATDAAALDASPVGDGG